jgi:hypothetical protein
MPPGCVISTSHNLGDSSDGQQGGVCEVHNPQNAPRTFRESEMLTLGQPVPKGRTDRQQRQTQLTGIGNARIGRAPRPAVLKSDGPGTATTRVGWDASWRLHRLGRYRPVRSLGEGAMTEY